jgi:outer membrane protein
MRNDCKINIVCFIQGIILLFINSLPTISQSSEILDNYIKNGLKENLSLQQKELNLEKSLHVLKEANGLFYPSIGLDAQYILSNGGRSIELPVGDMLNPVYSSLNQILHDMGQPGEFPQIANEKIQFLPNDYHDTKIRVIMPLVNAEIFYNRKIKKENISATQAEINIYRRELIKEIKIAYFRYLQTIKVVEAYKSALELINEARRVNKKLVENQMAGPEKLYRIEAEQSEVMAQLTKAENERNTAASYFNFLLNKPLQSTVIPDSILLNANGQFQVSDHTVNTQDREEIAQLNSAIKSTDYYYKLKKSYMIPSISNVTDLGYQGYSYTFDRDQQYVMNAINLSWSVFSGFQHRSRIALARIETESFRNRLTEVEQQIELQRRVAEDNLESSEKSEQASKSSLACSKEYYKVVSRQFATGQKSLLDLLDARNQLTSAAIGYHVSHIETLIRLAELERANASYDLSVYNN